MFQDVSQATVTVSYAAPTLALQCHFTNFLYIGEANPACLEVSLNGGKTFSSGCDSKLQTIRVPTILSDAFTPLNSHVADIVQIQFTGERFATDQEYVCVFTPQSLQPASVKQPAQTRVQVLSETEAQCPSPEPSAYLNEEIGTHLLEVTVVHLPSSIKVHTFSQAFTYFAYLELVEVFPLFGSEKGGTPLRVTVQNLITSEPLYESPLSCRFAFDFSPNYPDPPPPDSPPATFFYSHGRILSSSAVECPTPDVTSLKLFQPG